METVQGNHHLTLSVGPAQEDFDFHVDVLGMRNVKKTVLFDGTLPIYHLYYANADGDPSSVVTTFPFRQAGLRGRRGSNQVKTLNLAVPSGSLDFWAGRLDERGFAPERVDELGTSRVKLAHPCGIPYALVGVDGDERRGSTGGGVPLEHARRVASGPEAELFELGEGGHGNRVELVEEPDVQPGTWRFGEGTVHHVAFDAIAPRARWR